MSMVDDTPDKSNSLNYDDDDGRPAAGSGPKGTAQQMNNDLVASMGGGTSAFSASISSPSQLARYYYANEQGLIVPLEMRLRDFRDAYAQGGATGASLDQYVLDYQMYASPFAPRDKYQNTRWGQMESRKPTVQSLLELARNFKPDQVRELQTLLFESGYMSPKVYQQKALLQPGVYDIYTQDAWTTLLKDAVMAGDDDVMRTIERRKSAIDGMGGLSAWIGANEPQRDPFVAQLTSEEDISGVAEQVTDEMIGRRDEGFNKGLVGGYNAEETAAQRALYDAQPGGGTVVREPSVQGYAEEQLRKTHGTEVGAYAGLGAFNTILQDLGLAG